MTLTSLFLGHGLNYLIVLHHEVLQKTTSAKFMIKHPNKTVETWCCSVSVSTVHLKFLSICLTVWKGGIKARVRCFCSIGLESSRCWFNSPSCCLALFLTWFRKVRDFLLVWGQFPINFDQAMCTCTRQLCFVYNKPFEKHTCLIVSCWKHSGHYSIFKTKFKLIISYINLNCNLR